MKVLELELAGLIFFSIKPADLENIYYLVEEFELPIFQSIL